MKLQTCYLIILFALAPMSSTAADEFDAQEYN